MGRFYFNMEGSSGADADLVGREFENEEKAKAEAVRLAGELATEEVIDTAVTYDWIEVLDEAQRPVIRLPVGETARGPTRLGTGRAS